MSKRDQVFPFTLYNLTGRLLMQRETARMIANDQQLFSSFFAMAYKVMVFNDETHKQTLDPAVNILFKLISSASSKTFSMSELSESAKLADSIKRHVGQHVTSEYLGKFLAFADMFHQLQTPEYRKLLAQVPDVISSIGLLLSLASSKMRRGETEFSTVVEANIVSVKALFEMDDAEVVLLEHAALLSVDNEAFIFYRLFEQACSRKGMFKNIFEAALVDLYRNDLVDIGSFRAAMNAFDRAMSHKTSKPLAFDIVKTSSDGQVRQLSQFWTSVVTYDHAEGQDGFIKLFIKPVERSKSYSSVIARMHDKMIPLFKEVIEHASTYGSELGVNMLFYGPKSLDKDQALHRALNGVSYNLFEAAAADTWGDEASITWVAQRMLERKTKEAAGLNILMVREAANVLSRGRSSMNFGSLFGFNPDENAIPEKSKPRELDSDVMLLTESKTPTFWFTTDPTRLSPEAVGKFMLHLEVIPGTRADRKAEVEKIADSLDLPPEVRQALSKYMQLGAVQVETAARVVKMLEIDAPKSYETLLQLVEEGQRALGRDKTEELRTSVTTYDLGLLNIHGKFSPEQVIVALAKKKASTMCFYGMPGTGKTQLAEYIADKLDMPLLVKRASDILDKYVGGNEQNIAAMFAEAKAEGAILLLDEADSFLRDRALARTSWEVTMVNELLQQMERFPGIFICASNLFEQLDAAALRRFTFKFNFLELDELQRVKMFTNEAGVVLEVGTALHDSLMMIRHLTPGDFATVKRQSNLFDTVLTPDEWIKQLAEEAKAKNSGLARNHFTDTERM